MEVIVALGVPESTELFATLHWMDLTGSTTIRVRLVAVSSIIAEASIMRAILPAYGANTTVAILAVRVAQGTILLLVIWARGERLTSRTTVGLFPA